MGEEMICYIFGVMTGLGVAIFCPSLFKKLNDKVTTFIKSFGCEHKE
jgi:hypothetical protein